MRSTQPGAVRDLGAGVYQLPTDYPEVANAPLWAYAVVAGAKFVVIDPGVQSTLERTLRAAVNQLGLEPSRADLLLATHGHPDHAGGLGPWQAVAPHARVGAPLADVPWVEGFDRQWTQFWDDYPGTLDLSESRPGLAALCVPEPTITLPLRDGDKVTVGDRTLAVTETRGHTWGHCAYFDPVSGALFTGDAVQGHGIISSDGTSVLAPLYLDVADARWGLARLLEMPFRVICPAHLPPVRRARGIALLHDSLQFIDEVDAMGRALVSRLGSTPVLVSTLAEQIGKFVGTKPPISIQTVATARAHLRQLAREGILQAAWIPRTRPGSGGDRMLTP